MEEIISRYIGEWGWLTIVAIVTFAFKDAITNFFKGIQFLMGDDFNLLQDYLQELIEENK